MADGFNPSKGYGLMGFTKFIAEYNLPLNVASIKTGSVTGSLKFKINSHSAYLENKLSQIFLKVKLR